MSDQEEYNRLVKKISTWLDTRDKRFMFLWVLFPNYASRINLEGSSSDCAYRIVDFFDRAGCLVKLKNAVDLHL